MYITSICMASILGYVEGHCVGLNRPDLIDFLLLGPRWVVNYQQYGGKKGSNVI